MKRQVEHDESGGRGTFFIMQDGQRIAEMTYSRAGAGLAVIDHTEVNPELRGQGVARQLLDAVVNWARENDIKLRATCSYVVIQFGRDKSIQDVRG